MNLILGYYKNDGLQASGPYDCDYVQIKLIGPHALENNSIALISNSDLEIILQFIWYLSKDGYPVTYSTDDKSIIYKNGLKMHKLLIQDIQKGYVIDHINRNKLDNRRNNLRICTQKQNSYNTSKSINSINNYKGVRQQTNTLWTAIVTKDKKIYKIKDILTDKEAAIIYDSMAEELFGEFAGKNFY